MKILITIKNKKIRVALVEGKGERDFLDISEERSMAEKLLLEIDKLLRKNKLEPGDIRKMEVDSDQEDSFTTTRIAKAAANVWNDFAV